MNRIVTLQGTFSDSDVRFRSLRGKESLSALYEFELEVLSANYSLDIKQTLGKPLSLSIALDKGTPRQLAGQVSRMELIGRESNTSRDYVYRLSVRPWLWFLTCTSDCKIFQKKSVVEILDEVFSDYDYPVEKRLTSTYRQWEYCVQYQETDFNFVSRLMEQEGIYYFFEHNEAGETLVLADDISTLTPMPGYAELAYLPPDRLVNTSEVGVTHWQVSEEVRPGSYMVGDYDFSKPKADMRQLQINPQQHSNDQFEMYDWMGGFIDQAHAESYSRIRLEEAQALREQTRAQSQLPAIMPGFTFTLDGHPRNSENRDYLVVSADYDFHEAGYASGSEEARYDTRFIVQPTTQPYRAPRLTPLPLTHGPQTARVVGPAGEEIWTDQYGRVKVQFHWDRYGQSNENSSCWVRVSSSWAGSNFGGLQIPRIGQEVVVNFINGMPDRPLIVGCVYNADQMPPFNLPAASTQSGIVTRSLQQGTTENASMLRFDDKRGAEQVRLHAERNLDTSVENDETHKVNKHRTKHVQGNEASTIGGHQHREVHGNINTRSHQCINMEALKKLCMEACEEMNQTSPSLNELLGQLFSMVGAHISLTGASIALTGAELDCTGLHAGATLMRLHGTGCHIGNHGAKIQNIGAGINTYGALISIAGFALNNYSTQVKTCKYKVTC